MLDYSQAFEKVSHQRGIRSFINNNVRPPLIPVLISFFENREIQVKWNGMFSKVMKVNAGSAQGVSAGGVLEFLSLTNGNLFFLEDDEGWKYIDDTNFIEVINLTLAGLSSFNFKQQVCSDIATDAYYLSPTNLNSQQTINKICEWSKLNYMKLNFLKTKYMVINFCRSAQFNTRLTVENNLLEQVQESRILGVTVTDDLKWGWSTWKMLKDR